MSRFQMEKLEDRIAPSHFSCCCSGGSKHGGSKHGGSKCGGSKHGGSKHGGSKHGGSKCK